MKRRRAGGEAENENLRGPKGRSDRERQKCIDLKDKLKNMK